METINTQTNNKIKKQAKREKLTLLIIDKKQVNTVLEKKIMNLGNRVIVAECYSHAIQAATNTRNDLITINMNLSGNDRAHMISKIKEVVGAYNVVSTDGDVYDMSREQKEKQILYYIKKPLEVNDIQSILEQVSRKKTFSAPMPN